MKRCCLWVIGCLACTPLLAAEPAALGFRAGAATSNITPFLGGDIVGGFAPFPSTNVHDELHARCLVLDDGRTKLALVVCDLLAVGRGVSTEARKLVEQGAGIPPGQVLISAVHTHSACSAMGADRLKSQTPLDEYHRFVARRIADGVQRAVNTLRPAQMAYTTAAAPEHVFNRRWLMKPGTAPPNPFGGIDQVKMNPTVGGPDLVAPAGPTDPAVSVLAFRESDGRPIAVFSSYGLHYVGRVGSGDISADYYGVYCHELARLLNAQEQDPPFVALMANGASGDVTSTNRREPEPAMAPYEKMRRIGKDIARKVHAALAKVEYRDDVTLAARYRDLMIDCRCPTPEQMAWAKQTLAQKSAKTDQPGKTDLSAIYADRTLRLADGPEATPVPLQVFRIGPVCIGTMPTEVFCEIGLEFKKRSPIQPAQLISLAHGYLGYLPTPRHFPLGGYETWIGTSRLEPNASEKMLDALLEMAAEIKN